MSWVNKGAVKMRGMIHPAHVIHSWRGETSRRERSLAGSPGRAWRSGVPTKGARKIQAVTKSPTPTMTSADEVWSIRDMREPKGTLS